MTIPIDKLVYIIIAAIVILLVVLLIVPGLLINAAEQATSMLNVFM